MTSSAKLVSDMYDGCAHGYATMMDSEIDLPMYVDVFSRLEEAIAKVPGPIVDTSCGSGHMLERYRLKYSSERGLIGVDLSPEMIAIARKRLGAGATIIQDDMRVLAEVDTTDAAAVLSFFALHHLSADEIPATLKRWRALLTAGGFLALAAWEGNGPIDYGGSFDIVALRYTADELSTWAAAAGFTVGHVATLPFEDMGMDAVCLYATKS